jgi:hypothetical protein
MNPPEDDIDGEEPALGDAETGVTRVEHNLGINFAHATDGFANVAARNKADRLSLA